MNALYSRSSPAVRACALACLLRSPASQRSSVAVFASRYSVEHQKWETEPSQPSKLHTDWVRDVAWAPSLGASDAMVASCSQDKKVVIWTQDASGAWNPKELLFGCVLWRVSWSVTGNVLAVSGGDNMVTLWKQNLLGDWEQVGQLAEEGAAASG